MAGYLGNTPIENYSTAARQTFSSPTGTGFALSKSVSSSNDIALFVNNVRQDPTTYTATGTTLTLTEALVSGDTMWCMFYGQATHTVTPSAGSVGDAAITAMAASKLTGALPAISGASLTNLPSDVTKSTSEPAGNTNPSGGVGTLWLRTTTGEMYCCTDATNNANVWTNIGDGTGLQPWIGMAATGGTITTDGDYKVHTFNSSGTFTVTTEGTTPQVEYLVIAGGGGSGGWGGGGGGAGGYRTATNFAVSAQAYTITIGAGGAGSTSNSGFAAGSNSVFGSITSLGGGKGSGTTGAGGSGTVGGNGGSGGGGTWASTAGGSGTAGQGNDGGQGGIQGNAHSAGGGGGAGEVGEAGSNSKGGDGGDGSSSSITGSAVTRAGGGGGASHSTGSGGAAGSGGGGKGSSNTDSGQESGTANTGGGGGGANSGSGGSGGSGVVILRYKFQ